MQLPRPCGEGVNFVSIGANCLPRTVLKRWGLLPSGALSTPLDFLLCSDNGSLRLVIADFEDLTDPARLSWDSFGDCPRNQDLEAVFGKEVGEYWGADNYFALRARFGKRIGNFRDMLRSGQDTVFIYCSHTRFTEATRRLLLEAADCLGRRTAGSSAVLAVVTGACEADLSNPERGMIRVLDLPLPYPGYVFHSLEDYSSVDGVAFERTIVSAAAHLASSLRLGLTVPV